MPKVRLGVASCMTSFTHDWRETKFTKSHAWIHPRIAVKMHEDHRSQCQGRRHHY